MTFDTSYTKLLTVTAMEGKLFLLLLLLQGSLGTNPSEKRQGADFFFEEFGDNKRRNLDFQVTSSTFRKQEFTFTDKPTELTTTNIILAKIGENREGSPQFSKVPMFEGNDIQLQEYLKEIPSEGVFKHVIQTTETSYKNSELHWDVEVNTKKYEARHLGADSKNDIYRRVESADINGKPIDKQVVVDIVKARQKDMRKVGDRMGKRVEHHVAVLTTAELEEFKTSVKDATSKINANKNDYTLEQSKITISKEERVLNNGQWSTFSKSTPTTAYELDLRNKNTDNTGFVLNTVETNQIFQFSKTSPGAAVTNPLLVSRSPDKASMQATFHVASKNELLNADLKTISLGLHHVGVVESGTSNQISFTAVHDNNEKQMTVALSDPSCRPRRSRDELHGIHRPKRFSCSIRTRLTSQEPTQTKKVRIENKLASYQNSQENGLAKRPSLDDDLIVHSVYGGSKTPSKLSRMLSAQDSLSKGQLFQDIGTGKVKSKGLRVGAVALKSGYHKLQKLSTQLSNTKFAKKFGKFSSSANYAFLIKDFANALRHGDMTSITIMGGMMGTGVASQLLISNGQKLGNAALKTFGKVLGVGLDVVGVAFDVVSVVDSHKCLKAHSENKAVCVRGAEGCVEDYNVCGGRNAVAEVVTSYVQLGLGLASAAVSLIFPPAAPFIAIFNLLFNFGLSEYQAREQVNSFAKYFPLTNAEKEEQVWRVTFGDTINQKFQTLREQSKANGQLMNSMGEFLKTNKGQFWAFLGPASEALERKRNLGRKRRAERTIIEVGVYIKEDEFETYYEFEEFADNEADLTDFAFRYFDRWSPNPIEMTDNYKPNKFTDDNFFCRPLGADSGTGASFLQGYSYKCVNALGYRSQNASEKLFAYFNLKAGDDKAVGYPTSPNYFVVGGGNKDFEGGELNDIFILGDETPGDVTTGVLKGGNGNDTLQINPSFNNKIKIEVLVENNEQFVATSHGKIQLVSIENIFGRERVPDYIEASCQNRYIDGKGGNQYSTDIIEIAKLRCLGGFAQEVMVNVPPSTKVTNYNKNRAVKYAYNIGNQNNGIVSKRKIVIENNPGDLLPSKHTINLAYTLTEITECTCVHIDTNSRVKLSLQASGRHNLEIHFQLHFDDPDVYFGLENNVEIVLIQKQQSSSSTSSQMELDALFKILVSTTEESVVGNSMGSNMFILNTTETDSVGLVQGGDSTHRSNTFIFITNSKIWTLDGQNGPDNTIEFHTGVYGSVLLDLQNRTLQFNGGKVITRLAGKFQRIQSRASGTLRLTTDCHVHSLDTKSKTVGGDQIIIPEISCPNQKLQIRVYDTTHVTSLPILGQYFYFVEKGGIVGSKAHINIFSGTNSTAQHHVVTEYSPNDFQTLSFDPLSSILNAETSNLNLVVHLEEPLKMDPKSPKFVFLLKAQAQIILTPSPDQQRAKPDSHQNNHVETIVAFQFDLNHGKETKVIGDINNPNIFLVQTSSNQEIDLVQGGNKSDTFLFIAHSKVKRIECGIAGQNLIELTAGVQGHVTADMVLGKIEFKGPNYTTLVGGKFQHFLGRPNLADRFVANCDTETIDLKNGNIDQLDTILIPLQNCTPLPGQVKIHVRPFTNVTNELPGVFIYSIPRANQFEPNLNLTNNGGQRTIHIVGPTQSTHFIQLKHLPHEFTTLNFDSTSMEYTIRAPGLHLVVTMSTLSTSKTIYLVLSEDVEINLDDGDGYELSFRWNLTSVPGPNVLGGKYNRNRFLIQSKYDRIKGGEENDVFILGPNAQVQSLESGGGDDALVFMGQPNHEVVRLSEKEISFSMGNDDFPYKKTTLIGRFPYVHLTEQDSTLIPDPCTTKLIDVSDPDSYTVIKIMDERSGLDSNCVFDDLTIKISPNTAFNTIVNEAHSGLFRFEIPAAQENTLDFVITNHLPKNSSKPFQQIYQLPLSIFDISNIIALPENLSVALETLDESVFTFRIDPVWSEELQTPSTTWDQDTTESDYYADNTTLNDEDDPMEMAEAVFPFYFLTTDGYETTVNHVGGLHAIIKLNTEPGNVNQVIDLIADHTDLCNQLGMTLLINLVGDEQEQEKIIQIGGDDEMDFLINQESIESHLVGNSMGSQNTFYITPTISNNPVYVYLVEPYQMDFAIEVDEDMDDLEMAETQKNVIILQSFYDQRPQDIDPMDYVPYINIPTVEESEEDLIITVRYPTFKELPMPVEAKEFDTTTDASYTTLETSTDASDTTIETPTDLEEQTIVFVEGVSHFKRMFVKLYSILYEFKRYSPSEDSSSFLNVPSEPSATRWELRPVKFSFEAQFNSDEEEIPTERHGNSLGIEVVDEDGSIEPDDTAGDPDVNFSSGPRRRRSTKVITKERRPWPNEHLTLITYGDILEYQMAAVPLEIKEIENFDCDRSLYSSSGEDLILTNYLQTPGFGYYLGLSSDRESTRKTTVVLIGIKTAMEQENFTITFSQVNEEGKRKDVIIGSNNFTEILVDVTKAEETLDFVVWWVQIAVFAVMALMVLIGLVILYKIIRLCCRGSRGKYRPGKADFSASANVELMALQTQIGPDFNLQKNQ